MRKILVLALATALLSACASTPPVPEQLPPNVVAQQTEIQEQEQTLSRLEAVVRVLLRNEGPVAANASRAQYELVVDGQVLDTGEAALAQPIAPGAEQTVEFRVPFVYAPDQQRILELDGRRTPLKYAVRGVIDVGGAQVEFARASEVRSPRLPKLGLTSFEVLRTETKGLTVNASVSIANPNPFHVVVDGLRYKVQLGGMEAGEGTLARGAKLPLASENIYELSIALEESDLKAKGLSIDAAAVGYVLEGTLEMDGLAVELNDSGETRLLSGGY